MTTEEFGRVLAGLYSYAHSNNRVAAHVYDDIAELQEEVHPMSSLPQRHLLSLMENLTELAAWWEQAKKELSR